MRFQNGQIVLSPSDLMRFQGCAHATSLDLRYARGEPLVPAEDGEDAKLLQKKGFAHEAAYLGRIDPSDVVTIQRTPDFALAGRRTIEAMQAGARVIYQGAMATGPWQGWSDFIERVDAPSDLGEWSYEVADTKLKRRADPKHAQQLSIYSRAVAEIQGTSPRRAHVLIGTGERVSFDLSDVSHYADRLAERLTEFVAAPWSTRPEPTKSCGLCRWRDLCAAHYRDTDSLVLVAGITSSQRRRLETAGIATLTDLAKQAEPVSKMSSETLDKLRTQACLQLGRREGGQPTLELKSVEPGLGFTRLPKPSPGDLFFDMEGDPLVVGGLEYLFGVYEEGQGEGRFHAWWAHDRDAECKAVMAVLEFFVDRLAADPAAHIYHYNHYEVTALKKLTQRFGVGEAILDHLLRSRRFVDLYRVVQQGLMASEKGYSLKDLEVFYMDKRHEEVATAGDSIIAYEEWLETRHQRILDDIERYNEVDCRSTKGLRDWLISVRPPEATWATNENDDPAPDQMVDAEREALRGELDGARSRLGDRFADLLLELNAFHRRADKPAWWEYFDRLGRDGDELIDDLESLGGLVALGAADGLSRTYEYPPQETKLRQGDRVFIRSLEMGASIEAFDRRRRRVTVKGTRKTGPLPDRIELLPAGPINNKVLREAVAKVTDALIKGESRCSAIADFLGRRPPRMAGRFDGAPIVEGDDLVAGTIAAIVALDRSCLPIQGPPGTGKTYVSAKAIVELVRRGMRVAITSNAHKAIDNLLLAVASEARAAGRCISIAKKITNAADGPDDPMITAVTSNDDQLLDTADVVGGTAWLFARTEMTNCFDHLFIDEAGQVSVANLLAVSAAADNIVLVGDQMQLPQPVQGTHPGESGLSTLDYLMDGERTIAAGRGIFLAISRRMHPEVCRVVSELVYDGRLSSNVGVARHRIDGVPGLPPFGVVFEEIAHEGNAQSSEEEAERIGEMFRALRGATFTDHDGVQRLIGIDDILVVSPYNAQVNLLTERLPDGARVGTVDRFQGQEAPVCLISMATSSADEMPRDIEFLFSLNRLNVALSRAQALAVIVASPSLLDVPCSTMEDMKLVNGLCAVRNWAKGQVDEILKAGGSSTE